MQLVIVGDQLSGRTELLPALALAQAASPGPYIPVHLENYLADLTVDGQPVEAALWEASDLEDCDRLRPLYYRDSHGIILTFAIDAPQSLDKITLKIRRFCRPKIPIMLVGCKPDLRPPDSNHPGFVSPQQGERLAAEIDAVGYREFSALSGIGVVPVFEDLARAVLVARRRDDHAKGSCLIA